MEQDKLSKFRGAVFSNIEKQIQEIEAETEELKKASLAQTENEQLNNAYAYIQNNVAKIKNENKLLIAKKELALKQDVLLKREEYRGRLLDNIRSRLLEFVASADYKPYILEKLKNINGSYQLAGSIIRYKTGDTWFEQEAKQMIPSEGCKFEADSTIQIGGFVIRNDQSGFVIDETFEAKLQEQMPYFNQNCRICVD